MGEERERGGGVCRCRSVIISCQSDNFNLDIACTYLSSQHTRPSRGTPRQPVSSLTDQRGPCKLYTTYTVVTATHHEVESQAYPKDGGPGASHRSVKTSHQQTHLYGTEYHSS